MYIRTRRTQHGDVALNREARDWKDTVTALVGYEAQEKHFPIGNAFPSGAQLALSYRCVGVRGDADNYAKLIQDGIAVALGINDRRMLITHAEVTRPVPMKRTTSHTSMQTVGVYLTLDIVQVVPFGAQTAAATATAGGAA